MGRSHHLPRQPDPVEALLEDEHNDGGPTQLEVQSSAVNTSSALTSKLVISILLWFAVLLYGVLPSRLDTAAQNGCELDCVKVGKTAGGANTTRSSVFTPSTMSQSWQRSMRIQLATRVPRFSLTPSRLRELCQRPLRPLFCTLSLQSWWTSVLYCKLILVPMQTSSLAMLIFANDSQYALPCPLQAKYVHSGSLARFTVACNKQQGCRSWWLRHQSQHGVCGCAPLMNLAYPNQHAPQAEQKQGSGYLALPPLSACVWLLIPCGRLSAPCCSSCVYCTDKLHRRSRQSCLAFL